MISRILKFWEISKRICPISAEIDQGSRGLVGLVDIPGPNRGDLHGLAGPARMRPPRLNGPFAAGSTSVLSAERRSIANLKSRRQRQKRRAHQVPTIPPSAPPNLNTLSISQTKHERRQNWAGLQLASPQRARIEAYLRFTNSSFWVRASEWPQLEVIHVLVVVKIETKFYW